jgi:hypothetical protein
MLFAYKLAKDNPDFKFLFINPYRTSICNFRNMCAEMALEVSAEYLMFVDDDAAFYSETSMFKALKDKIDDNPNAHMVMPVVYIRGYPFEPMFFKWDTTDGVKKLDFYSDFRDQAVDENKLLEVAAIGCHTALIKTEVFKAMEKPYFLTGLHSTEDVYFCMKCRDYIENIGIYVATDLDSSHLLDALYVDSGNRDIIKKLYEDLKFNQELDLSQPTGLKRELEKIGEDFER